MHVGKTAFLIVLLTFPRIALALDNDEDGPFTPDRLLKLHAKMDADANGKVSVKEILQFITDTRKSSFVKDGPTMIDEKDGDKDGKISLDEILKDPVSEEEEVDGHEAETEAARVEYRVHQGEKFKAADGDNDGLLDEMEFAAFSNPEVHDHILRITAQRAMENKDRDKDGLLTFDEFSEDPAAGLEGPELELNREADLKTFKKLDKDVSGTLDLEELLPWESGHVYTMESMEQFMQVADINRDQHVTVDELQASDTWENHGDARYYFMEMFQKLEL